MSSNSNPYGAFNFLVTIDGVTVAAFAECILPAVSIEVLEYRAGNETASNANKIPGLASYGNLTLKRGIPPPPTTLGLWDWFSTFLSGTGSPKTVTVTLLDSQQDPVLEWKFTNCWPVKYESPVLTGKTSALAIESVEIAVGGMAVTSTAPSG